MEASQQPLSLSQQNLALNIAEKGKEDAEEGGRRGRRTQEGKEDERKEDAENTERMNRCRTSAIRHTALGLSGWQSPPGLSLGPFLLACPPSNQQRWSPIPRPSGPFSSPVPRATSNAGVALTPACYVCRSRSSSNKVMLESRDHIGSGSGSGSVKGWHAAELAKFKAFHDHDIQSTKDKEEYVQRETNKEEEDLQKGVGDSMTRLTQLELDNEEGGFKGFDAGCEICLTLIKNMEQP